MDVKIKLSWTLKKGTKHYRQTITEEHVSLIEEPESKYLGHISPSTGTAQEVKRGIIEYLSANNISVDKLVAMGCDGTVTLTQDNTTL